MFGNLFWYAITVVFMGELLLHWAPFPRTLPRIVAYGLGLATILVGCAIWLIPTGNGLVFVGVLVICIAAGIATLLGYGVDALLNLLVRMKVRDDGEGD